MALVPQRAEELVAGGVLGADEMSAALEIAHRHAPSACTIGFIFGDFCAENAIVRDSGEICFIDHDTLSVDACEYDLARTWYRWPMTPAQRAVYLAGYGEQRALEPFLAHFPYWAIVVLIGAARFRLSRHTAGTAEPLRRLRALVTDLDQGMPPRDAAYT